jgi:hypothetical protein
VWPLKKIADLFFYTWRLLTSQTSCFGEKPMTFSETGEFSCWLGRCNSACGNTKNFACRFNTHYYWIDTQKISIILKYRFWTRMHVESSRMRVKSTRSMVWLLCHVVCYNDTHAGDSFSNDHRYEPAGCVYIAIK